MPKARTKARASVGPPIRQTKVFAQMKAGPRKRPRALTVRLCHWRYPFSPKHRLHASFTPRSMSALTGMSDEERKTYFFFFLAFFAVVFCAFFAFLAMGPPSIFKS